jgi:hypothetical protein
VSCPFYRPIGLAIAIAALGRIVTIAQTPPSAVVVAVPDTVQRVLDNVGCRRPTQSQKDTIARGHFVRASQDDWAALCLSGRSSFIFIVWGGTAQCPSTLATRHTTERTLTTSPADAVTRVLHSGQTKQKGSIDHDGIQDTSPGSAPTIQYCLNRSWVSVPAPR